MARETIFIVQTFVSDSGELKPEAPVAALNVLDARTKAAAAVNRCTGVVAYSRSGDVDLGEYDEPVIIVKYGKVPEVIADYG